ncbi:helix-turn-helix transcriptional regulator [Sphingomonas sp. R86520]|uniref:helix-turn-helix domain-containing protein n=1 Tax=Sphingomonas sp. R86520 TaxID=3093859 RepID=UPI0036D25DF8
MDRAAYDSLTPMERNCLRLAHHERKTEHIAHELGIAASTVNTHIFAARRKLGGISRLTAADQLRTLEAGLAPLPHSGGTGLTDELEFESDRLAREEAPPQTVSRPPLSIAEIPTIEATLSTPTEVREERATFVFDDIAPRPGERDHHGTALQRVLMILAMAVLIGLVLVAAPAIYDSTAQRIANSLERPHAK